MGTRPPLVLRLFREPTIDRGPSAEPTSATPPGNIERTLHRMVRTYASGSVPKGRRITPPKGDELDAATAAGDGPPDDPRTALIPVHRVQELLDIYTRFMGPAAKRVLDAQLRKLDASPRTLTLERLPELVKRLAKLIDTSEKRRGFLKAMTKFPGAIG